MTMPTSPDGANLPCGHSVDGLVLIDENGIECPECGHQWDDESWECGTCGPVMHETDPRVALSTALEENARLRLMEDAAPFNRGWEAARSGESVPEEDEIKEIGWAWFHHSAGTIAKLRAEIERLRGILRQTHTAYCTSDWTDRGLHAPECLLYEIEELPRG